MSLLFILFFCASISHASSEISKDLETQESKLEENKGAIENLEENVSSIDLQIETLSSKQGDLHKAINKSYKLQTEINSTASKLIEIIKNKGIEASPITIELLKPTNWYIYLLPIITIFIVICSTYLSIRTISIKSNEAISSLKRSNEIQVDINKTNIIAEHDRLQKSITSNNRQKWINSLRDDISSLLSIAAKSSLSKDEEKFLHDDLWLHFYKIQLLLNPKEDDHEKLISTIRYTLEKIVKDEDHNDDIHDIVDISTAILKREWERVKSFD